MVDARSAKKNNKFQKRDSKKGEGKGKSKNGDGEKKEGLGQNETKGLLP